MPTTRERKKTKVFSTPWISVSVTMSPFETWVISWPRTASTSVRSIVSSSPVDTATSDESRKAPVANALAGPSYIATSGLPMPALSARLFTVCTSQYCVEPSEPSMVCAPVDHLAMVFDMSSETKAPPKPRTAENMNSVG